VLYKKKIKEKHNQNERENERDLRTMLLMKISPRPDEKYLKKDQRFPIKGHPMSPGGSGYCLLLNLR